MLLQEAWAALKRLFWDANLNGVDWTAKLEVNGRHGVPRVGSQHHATHRCDACLCTHSFTPSQQYKPLIQRASTRSDFDDILQELVTELRTSHLYSSDGDA